MAGLLFSLSLPRAHAPALALCCCLSVYLGHLGPILGRHDHLGGGGPGLGGRGVPRAGVCGDAPAGGRALGHGHCFSGQWRGTKTGNALGERAPEASLCGEGRRAGRGGRGRARVPERDEGRGSGSAWVRGEKKERARNKKVREGAVSASVGAPPHPKPATTLESGRPCHYWRGGSAIGGGNQQQRPLLEARSAPRRALSALLRARWALAAPHTKGGATAPGSPMGLHPPTRVNGSKSDQAPA